MARGYESAGISYNEIEILPTSIGQETAPIAVIGGATKGSTNITMCTSANNLKNQFGEVTLADWGVRSVKRVLKNSTNVYFKRVVGADAKKGSTGIVGTCPFSFTTKEFDSTLNNAIVKVTYDTESKTVDYRLTNASGLVLEDISGFTYEKGTSLFIGDLFEKKTDLLDIEVADNVDALDDSVFKETKTVTKTLAYSDFIIETSEGEIVTDDCFATYTLTESREDTVITKLLINGENVVGGGDYTFVNGEDGTYTIKVNTHSTPFTSATLEYTCKENVTVKEWELPILNGDDGIASITAEDIIRAMKEFSNPEAIDISTLITPGWSDPKVIATGLEIAQSRGDILYLPEIPNGLTPLQAKAFVDATGVYKTTNRKMASGFMGCYYPWVKEYDATLGKDIETPATAWVASQFAYNDAVGKQWFATAGLQAGQNRGLLADATGVAYELTKDDRDLLYGTDGVINPIVNFQSKGVVIWGNKTTKRTPLNEAEAPTVSLNVRRLCNYIRKQIISISMSNLFDPNDSYNWNSWVLAIEPKLRAIKEARGIEQYKIIMDATTVSDDDKVHGRMPGQVYILPIKATEYIPINFVVTQDGIYFND